MDIQTWKLNPSSISGQEYITNQLVARKSSTKGFTHIINEYIYIHPKNINNTFKLIPKATESIYGTGIDLGGGVGCISSTLATRNSVDKIYCIEVVEDAVKLCQPIVKKEILKEKKYKVVSVIGDYDNLELEDHSIDFAVSWDSMHHSRDPVKTFKECRRVLKKDSTFIIVDRAHNNSTPDSEIQRMLNITYDEEFLTKYYRPKDTILTRSQNGEHEYRFSEWNNFFKEAGFDLIDTVIIKTESDENRKLKNDNNLTEIFVDYELGGFGNRKVAFVLKAN